MGRLDGRTAVVTGGSRGIGLAIAHRLVHEGAQVLITARRPDSLAAAAAEFSAGTVLTAAGRADDPEHCAAALDLLADSWGGLDILVNNAGINPVYGPTIDVDPAAARKILEVNVLASLAWTQRAVRHPGLHFAERGGSVVNVASVAGIVPAEGLGLYGVSKAALLHLTRTLGAELGPEIRVNAVVPAVVKTQFARALYEGKEEAVIGRYPLRRLGVPEDVAGAVAFLVSADAAWMTGQAVTVDGGLLAAGGSA